MGIKQGIRNFGKYLTRKSAIGIFFSNIFLKRKTYHKDFESVSEYCSKNDIKISKLNEDAKMVLAIPSFFEYQKGSIETHDEPSIFYTKLNSVLLVRDCDSIFVESSCLNEKKALPYAEYLKLDNWPVVKIKNNKCKYVLKKKTREIDEAISLVGLASNNFYHVIFDMLSKFAYINQFQELKSIPVVVDAMVYNHRIFKKLLDYLNVLNHPIEVIDGSSNLKIKTLHYFAPCSFSCVYLNEKKGQVPYRFSKDFYSLNYVKSNMLTHAKKVEGLDCEKLFLIRPSSVVKRLVNENNLVPIVQKYGFTIIDPSEYSIEEQIYIFSHAKHIIADEGAALVNLLWCSKGSSIGCIIPEEWHDYNYSTIAHFSEMNCHYLKAEKIGKSTFHKIDENYFERYVKYIMKI